MIFLVATTAGHARDHGRLPAQRPTFESVSEVLEGQNGARVRRFKTWWARPSFAEGAFPNGVASPRVGPQQALHLLTGEFRNGASYGGTGYRVPLPVGWKASAFIEPKDTVEATDSRGTPATVKAKRPADDETASTASSDTSASSKSGAEFEWDTPVPAAGSAESRYKPKPTAKALFDSFALDLQEKLALHQSSQSFYSEARRSGTSSDLPGSITSELCSKVLVRVVKEPSATSAFFSSVLARLGTAFKKVKAAGKLIMTKLNKLWAAKSTGGPESKAIQWIKKMASTAWLKMREILKKILNVVIRFLPLVLFIANLVFLGLAVTSFATAPNPLSLIAMICSIFNLLSFIFSSSVQVHTRRVTQQALGENSELKDMQLFGLIWGELRAEESIEGTQPELFGVGKPDEPKTNEGPNTPTESGTQPAYSSDGKRIRAAPDVRLGEEGKGITPPANLAEGEAGKLPDARAGEEEVRSPGEASAAGDRLKIEEERRQVQRAREIMHERITIDRIKVSFDHAKKKYKDAKAKTEKRSKRAWQMAKTGVRLLAESLNHGLNKLLARFGKAWHWAIVRKHIWGIRFRKGHLFDDNACRCRY